MPKIRETGRDAGVSEDPILSSKIPRPASLSIYRDSGRQFPPKVVWAREQGWLNVRDPWGQWHSIEAKDAPAGYARLASQEKRR